MWVNYRFDRSTVIIGAVMVSWITPLALILANLPFPQEYMFVIKLGLAVASFIVSFFVFAAIFTGMSALVNNIELNKEAGLIRVGKQEFPYSQVSYVELGRKYNQTRPIYSLVFHFNGTDKVGKTLVSDSTSQVNKETLLDMVQRLAIPYQGVAQESALDFRKQQVTQPLLVHIVQSIFK